jgi:hypothetical protein
MLASNVDSHIVLIPNTLWHLTYPFPNCYNISTYNYIYIFLHIKPLMETNSNERGFFNCNFKASTETILSPWRPLFFCRAVSIN